MKLLPHWSLELEVPTSVFRWPWSLIFDPSINSLIPFEVRVLFLLQCAQNDHQHLHAACLIQMVLPGYDVRRQKQKQTTNKKLTSVTHVSAYPGQSMCQH